MWIAGYGNANGQEINQQIKHITLSHGGIIRMDTTQKTIYLSFTGGDFNDGSRVVQRTLKRKKVKAHFFFTGDFYRLPDNKKLIKKLVRDGHYLGPHSDKHLLYASWENRDSTLVSKDMFRQDLLNNYLAMEGFGLSKQNAIWFMPPYEWYNIEISKWANEIGSMIVNFSPGTRSNADYTTPDMGSRYVDSKTIYQSIFDFERKEVNGLNGFILLIHIGTHPSRTDKFYFQLDKLIEDLRALGYGFSLMPEPLVSTDY